MSQLTIRGFDSRLERHLRELARERGISLNKAAILLLERGAGLGSQPSTAGCVGPSLDRFIGCWTSEQEREFLEAIEPLEQIDPGLWR